MRMAGLLSTVAAALALVAPAVAQDRTILMGTVVRPDGSLAQDMAVVVVGGKVQGVVPAGEAKTGEKDVVVRYPAHEGAVISPGLIDLRSLAGALNQTTERARTVDPSLAALDAVDVGDAFFRRALEAGVTAVMVTPSENNIVGGTAATLRTWSPGGEPEALRVDGPMTFNLGTSVLDVNVGPTSRAGVLTILRDALSKAKKENGRDDRVAKVLRKETDALVWCEGAEDVDAAVRTFSEHGVRPSFVLGVGALETIDDLGGSDVTLVMGPLTFGSSEIVLNAPARAEKAGAEVAFAGRAPLVAPVGLRASAALAVRYGLDPARARRGMTSASAKVAGVAGRTGSLEAGKDADIVVFSTDPLRLDAKVLEVYVQGVKAYQRVEASADGSWEQH